MGRSVREGRAGRTGSPSVRHARRPAGERLSAWGSEAPVTLLPIHSTPMPRGLFGYQVFVVEDEPVVSMMLEDMLAEYGCILVGAAATVDDALAQVMDADQIDAAILDVNLAGQAIFPVADLLRARQVPFVFATGNASPELTLRYPGSRLISKPYEPQDVAEALLDFVYGSA